ncbi:MAG: methyltransferase domain-containing protein [Trueperaceae bacterium]|nr:methyltransferase domain-containing protein [Trueperaceae bacterium]
MAKRKKPLLKRRKSAPPKTSTTPSARPAPGTDLSEALFEAEVLGGLAPFAEAELRALRGVEIVRAEAEAVTFRYGGPLAALRGLKTVVAVYALKRFEIPRPKALLGQQHWQKVLGLLRAAASQDDFKGFRFSAAGSDSPVFLRLAGAIRDATGLRFDAEEGELLLRVRPYAEGWEVLARLTARPLSARAWRVCNMAGGLNATLAVAMHRLAGVRAHDRVFNPFCGSGTLAIERAALAPAAHLVASDLDPEALACSDANIRASGFAAAITTARADATALSEAGSSFDVIVADLPWGDAVGSHDANARLYPETLRELARVAAPGARCVLLTHDIKLFERSLARAGLPWRQKRVVRVFHGGHYPRMYLLERLP